MDDAADHPAVINTRLALRIRRQMRLNPRELRVRQPETIPVHDDFLSEAVNLIVSATLAILWVRVLGAAPGKIQSLVNGDQVYYSHLLK